MSTTPASPSQPAKPMPRAHAAPANQPAPAQSPPPKPTEGEEAAEETPHRSGFLMFNAMPSAMVSGVVHFFIVIILAFLTIAPPAAKTVMQIVTPPDEQMEEVEEFEDEKIEINVDETLVSEERSNVIQQVMQDIVEPTDTPSVAMDVDAAPIAVELSEFGEETAPKNDLMATSALHRYGRFRPRRCRARQDGGHGWRHRGERGGCRRGAGVVRRPSKPRWQLELRSSHGPLPGPLWRSRPLERLQDRCNGDGAACRSSAPARRTKKASTRQTSNAGLYFLTSQMKVQNRSGLQAGDLAQGGGSMYSHGLASIVLAKPTR